MFECGDAPRAFGQARIDTFNGARRQEVQTLRRSEGSVFFSATLFFFLICMFSWLFECVCVDDSSCDSHGEFKLWALGEHVFRCRLAQGAALGDCGVTSWRKLELTMVHVHSKPTCGRSLMCSACTFCGSTFDHIKCAPLPEVHGVKKTNTVRTTGHVDVLMFRRSWQQLMR